MPGRKSISYAELRVGIVVSIALTVAMAATMYITREGGLPFLGGQYTVFSYLRDVNGLKAGSPIHLSGVEVGSVKKVEFAGADAPAPVKVTMTIRTDVQDRITDHSLVTVGSLGVLGEKMLDVDPGEPGGVPIEDGASIPGEAEGDPIKGIILDASGTMKDIRDLAGRDPGRTGDARGATQTRGTARSAPRSRHPGRRCLYEPRSPGRYIWQAHPRPADLRQSQSARRQHERSRGAHR